MDFGASKSLANQVLPCTLKTGSARQNNEFETLIKVSNNCNPPAALYLLTTYESPQQTGS